MVPRSPLTCHPQTSTDAVRAIHAEVSRSADALRLTFLLVGDLGRLRIPPLGRVQAGRDLWRHTCFEAFIAVAGAAPYHELNLAPAAESTVYAFDGYRDAAPLRDGARPPRIRVAADHGQLALSSPPDLGPPSPAY